MGEMRRIVQIAHPRNEVARPAPAPVRADSASIVAAQVAARRAGGRKGVLGWIGLGRRKPVGADSQLARLAGEIRQTCPGSRADRIAGIAEFFLRHDLEICPFTLGIALDYITGTDRLLIRLIDERAMIGQAVTTDWLHKLRSSAANDWESTVVNLLVGKLEKGLVEFGSAASEARRATSAYGTSLAGHAQQLGSSADLNQSVVELIGVVRAMIERTSEMEAEMTRSEHQSHSLRKNLETALRSADEDYLTGLPNRRAFEKTFEEEYRAARMAAEPLVVAFCDIDRFKQVNDTHGHDAGDRVLKTVARNLSRITSDRCYIARHGGEEFVLLFRGQTLDEANALLDRARADLAERRLVNRQTSVPIGHVTFSAGIADVFAWPDRRAALRAADSALYLAKSQGRNRIVSAAA